MADHEDIPILRYIDSDGSGIQAMPGFARDPRELIELYRAMVWTRAFDARAVALQRSGQLGTYASSLGQEAVSVGMASAMRSDDVLVPSFREHGAQLWRGVTPVELLLFWGGDERGNDFAGPREDFPVSIPVGSHAPHAAGVALAFKLRREPRAAVCVLGDGATSKGDFYEALNLAGVWGLPAVFVVVDNGWAISVPRSAQSAVERLADKAVAAGVPGTQVDGNDVVAVRACVDSALERARSGEGASLIDALTYRLADHTTADDSSRYRDESIVLERWREEPLARLRAYLESAGAWSEEAQARLDAECAERIGLAVVEFLATEPLPPQAMFDHLYATLPEELAELRDELARGPEVA